MLHTKEPYPPLTRSPFPMRGRLVWWRLCRLFDWVMPESSILVTSRFYDTRERIVSHAWHEILRLSPHLFWLGVFSHRVFLSAQDDDTGERVVSLGGGFAAFFIGAMFESGIQVTGYQS